VAALLVLASEGGGEKTLWDPTLLGILVFLSAVGLFCGSVYLLLATNLGARLGFLVAGACLTGFMVLLSSLWMITATPLNSPKGRLAEWDVVEIVPTLDDSSVAAVQDLEDQAIIDVQELSLLRPALDAALVAPPAEGEAAAEPSEFAQFGSPAEFLTDFEGYQTFEVGGGSRWLFWHEPKYAAVQICPTLQVEVPFGEAPPPPECDPLQPTQYVILERDLGSLRQPPVFYFLASLVLFGLCILGLHWREKDERARAAANAAESNRPAPVDA